MIAGGLFRSAVPAATITVSTAGTSRASSKTTSAFDDDRGRPDDHGEDVGNGQDTALSGHDVSQPPDLSRRQTTSGEQFTVGMQGHDRGGEERETDERAS